MTKELGKGPTFYDHRLIAELEKHRQALRDYVENDMQGAKAYLAEELQYMHGFDITHELAKSHVGRLAEQADF